MTEWQQRTLNDIAEVVMGQSPAGDTCNGKGLGLPLLNGPTEFGYVSPTPVQFTTDPKRLSVPDDLLFCVRGSTTGRMNWAQQEYAIGRGLAAIRHKNGPKYRFFLKGIIDCYLPYLLTSATGSTFPNISRDQISKLKVKIPPLSEQKEISDFFAAISLKIELNQRMNETLEGMARSIFKSWFVDFDPVHAKANGQQPAGMDAKTAALFPNRFTNDGLPEGWGIGNIGDIAKAKGGYAFKSKDFSGCGNPVIKIKNISKDGKVIIKGSQCIDDAIAAKADRFRLVDGDLVMAMTGATVGKSGLIVTTDSIPYLNQRVAKFESLKFGTKIVWFLFCLFKQEDIFNVLVGTAQGSAQPNISSSNLDSIKIFIATDEIISAYCEAVDHLFKLWIYNEKQNQTLVALRDTLLPKLISGELRVDTEPYNMKEATQ